MGNRKSISSLQVAQPSQPGEWIRQGTSGYCDIVRNAQTGLLAEQYSVAIDNRISKEQHYYRYEYRLAHSQNTVQVIQVEDEDSRFLCQGQSFLKVKTQRIPKRLSEMQNLTPEQGLLVLEQSMQGFSSIYSHEGAVLINDDMIGFTPDGRVKVWLNQNFAKNLPDIDKKAGLSNETVMVDQLLDVVEDHIKGGYPRLLKQTLAQNPPNKFNEAIDTLKRYLMSSRTVLPKNIRVNSGLVQVRNSPTKSFNSIGAPGSATKLTTVPQSINVPTTKRQLTFNSPQPRQIITKAAETHQTFQVAHSPQITKGVVTIRPTVAKSIPTVSSQQNIKINIPNTHTYYEQARPLTVQTQQSTHLAQINPQQHSQVNQYRSPQPVQQQATQSYTIQSNKAPVVQRIVASKTTPSSTVSNTSSTNTKVTFEPSLSNSRGVSNKLVQSIHESQNINQIMREPVTTNSVIRLQQPTMSDNITVHKATTPLVLQNQGVQVQKATVQPLIRKRQGGQTTTITQREVLKTQPVKESTKVTKAQTKKEPEHHSLQYQIEKLNQITKMVGVSSQPERRVEGSIGNLPVSFVSPLTQSKKIKFQQAPVPQKEQAFIKGQPIGATTGSPIKTPFLKKESVGTVGTYISSDTNQLITTTSSQSLTQLGLAKPKNTVPTFGQGTTIQQGQTTTTTTTTAPTKPANVITIKSSSTNRQPTTRTVQKQTLTAQTRTRVEPPKMTTYNATRVDAAKSIKQTPTDLKHQGSTEIEQLDALQSKLSEMVNKISTTTGTISGKSCQAAHRIEKGIKTD